MTQLLTYNEEGEPKDTSTVAEKEWMHDEWMQVCE